MTCFLSPSSTLRWVVLFALVVIFMSSCTSQKAQEVDSYDQREHMLYYYDEMRQTMVYGDIIRSAVIYMRDNWAYLPAWSWDNDRGVYIYKYVRVPNQYICPGPVDSLDYSFHDEEDSR